ncbi:hypothetical protein AOLI_G00311310 [Acnodon oligacanthus]
MFFLVAPTDRNLLAEKKALALPQEWSTKAGLHTADAKSKSICYQLPLPHGLGEIEESEACLAGCV